MRSGRYLHLLMVPPDRFRRFNRTEQCLRLRGRAARDTDAQERFRPGPRGERWPRVRPKATVCVSSCRTQKRALVTGMLDVPFFFPEPLPGRSRRAARSSHTTAAVGSASAKPLGPQQRLARLVDQRLVAGGIRPGAVDLQVADGQVEQADGATHLDRLRTHGKWQPLMDILAELAQISEVKTDAGGLLLSAQATVAALAHELSELVAG